MKQKPKAVKSVPSAFVERYAKAKLDKKLYTTVELRIVKSPTWTLVTPAVLKELNAAAAFLRQLRRAASGRPTRGLVAEMLPGAAEALRTFRSSFRLCRRLTARWVVEEDEGLRTYHRLDVAAAKRKTKPKRKSKA